MTFWCGSGSGSRIRIWIRGSMPLQMDPDADADPAIYVIDLQDANKKLFISFPAYFLFKVHLCTSFFKDKKAKRSHKTVGIKVFLTIFAW
jgi:hypothetical protein